MLGEKDEVVFAKSGGSVPKEIEIGRHVPDDDDESAGKAVFLVIPQEFAFTAIGAEGEDRVPVALKCASVKSVTQHLLDELPGLIEIIDRFEKSPMLGNRGRLDKGADVPNALEELSGAERNIGRRDEGSGCVELVDVEPESPSLGQPLPSLLGGFRGRIPLDQGVEETSQSAIEIVVRIGIAEDSVEILP